jgi:ABC-2 type transport system ATP-binding protein
MEKAEFAIDVRGLVKIYNGKITALDSVDLKIEAGKIFALLGPNGSGKTTLMRILTTQLKPTSGEAHISGLNVAREGSKVRKLIGYVPQEMSVWTDISGYENLLIYAKIYGLTSHDRKKIIDDELETMGLREVANNLVRTYSGGMIRRLEIACAMLIRPKILFLDEPTIGLDPSAKKVVWDKLTSFKKDYGATVFFNTHYMDEADLYSDEIAIISSGKIIKLGTAEELKRSIGGEVILFGLGNNVGEGILSRVKGLSLVSDVIVDNSEIRVVVEDSEIALPEVMEILESDGIPVKKVTLTKPTLDDVFLKYAGTSLESASGIGEVRQVRRAIKRG